MAFKRSVVSAAAAAAVLCSGSALAGVSGNVGVVSEYLFRGIEQSTGAAVQGGLDYGHDSGFYAGTWASTISFASGSGSGAEVDFYTGFAGEAGALGFDVGAIYYWYSEEDEAGTSPDPSNNTTELYGSLSLGPATLGVYYSLGDYFAVTDDPVLYPYLDLSFPLSEKLSLDLHVGQQTFDDGTIEDIVDYSLGLSMDAGNGFGMALALVNTDREFDPDGTAGSGDEYDDKFKFVVSGSYSFDL